MTFFVYDQHYSKAFATTCQLTDSKGGMDYPYINSSLAAYLVICTTFFE